MGGLKIDNFNTCFEWKGQIIPSGLYAAGVALQEDFTQVTV